MDRLPETTVATLDEETIHALLARVVGDVHGGISIRTAQGYALVVFDHDGPDPMEHLRHLALVTGSHDASIALLPPAPARDPLYLFEGESSLLLERSMENMVALLSVEAADMAIKLDRQHRKSDAAPLPPEQEKGFYRKFEHRRRDGSVRRGRR